jgi:type II secretory pathway predicted ATPase ExeA
VACHAYWRGNWPSLEDTSRHAFANWGLPQQIFVDNGKVFHANEYERILTELNVGLIYSTANLYLTDQHRAVLRRLEQTATHGACAALTGEVGVGKSTLLRALYDRLPTAKHTCHHVGSDLPSRGIMRAVARGLGLTPYWLRADLIEQVQHAVADQYEKAGRRTLLTSHLLKHGVLEDLRLLTNFKCDSQPILSLLLLGQPPLRERLTLKAVEALTQRLEVQLTLEPLGKQETGEYLRHHLALAGATGPVFSGSAENMIFDRTQGIPRRINLLALQCLEMACERGEKIVDERLVELAVSLS